MGSESDDSFHSLSHSRADSLAADPTFLPTYEPEPLIGAHQPRQELIVDEEVSILSELKLANPPEARPVSPVELFYDLFIAATLAKLGPVLAENLSEHPIQIVYFIVVFLLVFESWIQTTYFINRFASESASDQAFIFWNLVALGGLNINIRRCVEGVEGHDCQGVSAWLAFARGGVCLWLCIAAWQTRHEHPKAYDFTRYNLAANLLILALLTLAALLPFSPTFERNDLGALSAALLVSLFAPLGLWLFREYRQAYVPMNSELAAERFSLIYIVSLGEIILSGVVPDLQRDDSWGDMLRSSGVMLLGVLTAWLFLLFFFSLYDLSAKKVDKPLEMSMLWSWVLLRATSLLAMLSALVAAVFERLANNGGHSFPSRVDRDIISFALALKVAVFSLTSRLYVRHVTVAFDVWADLGAILLEGLFVPLVFAVLVPVPDLAYTALSVGVLAVLAALRAFGLPVRLTPMGVQEALALRLGQTITVSEEETRRRTMHYSDEDRPLIEEKYGGVSPRSS